MRLTLSANFSTSSRASEKVRSRRSDSSGLRLPGGATVDLADARDALEIVRPRRTAFYIIRNSQIDPEPVQVDPTLFDIASPFTSWICQASWGLPRKTRARSSTLCPASS